MFLLELDSPSPSSSHTKNPHALIETQNPPSSGPISMAKDKLVQSSTRPLLHYSRRKAPIVQPMQIQELESAPGNEVITQTEPSQEIVSDFHEDNEPNLPIALRKGTKKCTQRPLYPLSHFMSYEKLSHNHKTSHTSKHHSHSKNCI